MYNLIKVTEKDGQQLVDARELWYGLESKQEFAHWIKNKVINNPFFEEDTDWIVFDKSIINSDNVSVAGGRPQINYILTLDTAKKVAMAEQTERGNKVREYFIEAEKQARGQLLKIPQTKLEWIQFSLDQEKEIIGLSENNKVLTEISELQDQLIEEAEPKVDFYDTVTKSDYTIDMGLVATTINMGIGRNRLFQFLRNQDILMDSKRPYQKYVDRGYFRTIERSWTKSNGEKEFGFQTVVYQKGVEFIIKKLKEAGYVRKNT